MSRLSPVFILLVFCGSGFVQNVLSFSIQPSKTNPDTRPRLNPFVSERPVVATTTTTAAAASSALHLARGPSSGGGRRYQPIINRDDNRPPMNEEITATQLRVVTPTPKGKDEALGVMSRDEALLKAKELGGLDLILINNNSDPPVCKIVDYSKYRYMQEKKAKEVKKNSKASELKEVKMSYKIDVHDYSVRKTSASKFLKQGDRVKCTVMFRGREVQHDNLGFDLLNKMASELENVCITEGRPKREGRNLSLILTPRPELLKLLNEQRRASDKAKKQKKESVDASREAESESAHCEDNNEEEDDYDEEDDDDDNLDYDEISSIDEPKVVEHTKSKADKTLDALLGGNEFL